MATYTAEQAALTVTSLDWGTDPTPDVNWSLAEGFFLGLQLNSDNTKHQCYVSLQALKLGYHDLPDYIRAVTGTDDSESSSSGNTIIDALPLNSPWYQPATYFKLFKRG